MHTTKRMNDDTQLSEKTRCLLSFTCQICRRSIIPLMTRFQISAPLSSFLSLSIHHACSLSLSHPASFLMSRPSNSHFYWYHLCLNHGHLPALLSLSLIASVSSHNHHQRHPGLIKSMIRGVFISIHLICAELLISVIIQSQMCS